MKQGYSLLKEFSNKDSAKLIDIRQISNYILNELNTFIFIFDVDNLRPLWINDYFKKRMGYSCEEAQNVTPEEFLGLFHPKCLPVFLERIKNIQKNIHKDIKTVYQLKTKQQEWIFLLTSSCVFERNKDGSIKTLIGYATEVNSYQLKHNLDELTSLKQRCNDLSLIGTLSRREFDIIRLITCGLTDKEISSKLSISIHTTKTHRKRIIQKLQVKNTASLVKFAMENSIC
jgi:DNA-binding CsgD family transcriptional regulator